MKSSTNCPFQSLSLVMSYVLIIWQIIERGECSVLQASMCVPVTDNSRYILDLLMYNLEIEGFWITLPELHNLIICAQTAAPWAVCLWRLPRAQGLRQCGDTGYKHEGYQHPDVTSQEHLSAALRESPHLLTFWGLCLSEWHTVL